MHDILALRAYIVLLEMSVTNYNTLYQLVNNKFDDYLLVVKILSYCIRKEMPMFKNDLRSAIGSNEIIVWQGKPDKKTFFLECIFNPLLPFALIWAAIDLSVFGGSLFAFWSFKEARGFFIGLILFFLLHMIPVWLYLGGIIFSFRKYRNTEYIVTNLGVYISGGIFSYSYKMKPFAELSHVDLHRGIFDQWFGVGDVVLSTFSISNIRDYQKVYRMIMDMQTDIYSDTMYPNDLRPEENHCYRTSYTKINDYRNDFRN